MARSIRAGHRRDVLKILAEAKRCIAWMQNGWTAPSVIYDWDQRDEYGNAAHRPRRQDEYPENDPAQWQGLGSRLDDLIAGLTILRQMAAQREALLRNQQAHPGDLPSRDGRS